ncbi:MAG: sialidase family protein, partial [Vicinamibacterales bacterium]
GRMVVATWSASTPKGETDIYASVSADGGTTFGTPVRVNSAAGTAKVNGEQAPRVTLAAAPSGLLKIVVVWVGGVKAGTALLSARSDDGGKTFGAAAVVPGSDAAGSRGWQSAAADNKGVVHALWLDHRGLVPPAGAAGTHTHGLSSASGASSDGVAMAEKSALYASVVGRADSVRTITNSVCYCCKTAMVSAADGSLYVAWRHVFPGGIRDIAAAVSKDGGLTFSAPAKVSNDGWKLNACPDDGPAMAIDKGGRLHVVWPTLVKTAAGSDSLGLFHATSMDGRTFTARERVPTEGLPHHPQVAATPDGGVVVTWDESTGGSRRVAFARAPGSGGPLTRIARVADGSYPVAVSTGDATIAAWTTAAGIRIEKLEGR